MSHEPSTHEHNMNTNNTTEGSCMELTAKQELISKLKEAREEGEFTYQRILEKMAERGKFVSLSTLKRVFAKDAEENAGSFSLENTLMPIADVLLEIEDVPTDPDSPYALEIQALKSAIHAQNEEITRLHDMNEHLEKRITFLLEQIEKKDRRMDEKDDIIRRLMSKLDF